MTLALPVYNDSWALQQTLSSILQAVGPSTLDVEIVVSDNDSVDDAYVASKAMLAGYPNAKVLRQDTNIGFAGNLKALAEISNGTYIWYIGAGDTLVPQQLPEILRLLERHSPDFGTIHGRFNFHKYWEYEPPEQKLNLAESSSPSTIGFFNHALSLNIIKRSIMLNYKLPPAKPDQASRINLKTGTDPLLLWESEVSFWPHLEAVCQSAEHEGFARFTWFEYHALSVLLNHNKNGTWDKGLSAMKIFVQWAEITDRTRRALPNSKWIGDLDKQLRGKHLFKFLFMLRKDHTLSPRVALGQARSLNLGPAKRMFAKMIMHCPRFMVVLLVKSRKAVLLLGRMFSRK